MNQAGDELELEGMALSLGSGTMRITECKQEGKRCPVIQDAAGGTEDE